MRIHTLPTEAIRKLKAWLSYRARLVKAKHSFKVSAKELKAHETAEVADSIYKDSQQMLQQINEQLNQLEKAIDQFLEQHAELKKTYELLLSVPGIGPDGFAHDRYHSKFRLLRLPEKIFDLFGDRPFQV